MLVNRKPIQSELTSSTDIWVTGDPSETNEEWKKMKRSKCADAEGRGGEAGRVMIEERQFSRQRVDLEQLILFCVEQSEKKK